MLYKLKIILFFIVFIVGQVNGQQIFQLPLEFNQKRQALTLDYIHDHYDPSVTSINIQPRIVVIHWSATDNVGELYKNLNSPILPAWKDTLDKKHSKLNLSTHFVVSQEGIIYQLMPETWMARHTIGLNRSAIGIENIGGPDNPLTDAQLQANAWLVGYLTQKYATIDYLIGHYEYTSFWNTPLWEEKNLDYLTIKQDPSPEFMMMLRSKLRYLALQKNYIQYRNQVVIK